MRTSPVFRLSTVLLGQLGFIGSWNVASTIQWYGLAWGSWVVITELDVVCSGDAQVFLVQSLAVGFGTVEPVETYFHRHFCVVISQCIRRHRWEGRALTGLILLRCYLTGFSNRHRGDGAAMVGTKQYEETTGSRGAGRFENYASQVSKRA